MFQARIADFDLSKASCTTVLGWDSNVEHADADTKMVVWLNGGTVDNARWTEHKPNQCYLEVRMSNGEWLELVVPNSQFIAELSLLKVENGDDEEFLRMLEDLSLQQLSFEGDVSVTPLSARFENGRYKGVSVDQEQVVSFPTFLWKYRTGDLWERRGPECSRPSGAFVQQRQDLDGKPRLVVTAIVGESWGFVPGHGREEGSKRMEGVYAFHDIWHTLRRRRSRLLIGTPARDYGLVAKP